MEQAHWTRVAQEKPRVDAGLVVQMAARQRAHHFARLTRGAAQRNDAARSHAVAGAVSATVRRPRRPVLAAMAARSTEKSARQMGHVCAVRGATSGPASPLGVALPLGKASSQPVGEPSAASWAELDPDGGPLDVGALMSSAGGALAVAEYSIARLVAQGGRCGVVRRRRGARARCDGRGRVRAQWQLGQLSRRQRPPTAGHVCCPGAQIGGANRSTPGLAAAAWTAATQQRRSRWTTGR